MNHHLVIQVLSSNAGQESPSADCVTKGSKNTLNMDVHFVAARSSDIGMEAHIAKVQSVGSATAQRHCMKWRCPSDVPMEVGMIEFCLSVLILDHCFTPDGSDVLTVPCCAYLSFGAHVRVRRVVGSFLCDLARVGTSDYASFRNVMHGASGCVFVLSFLQHPRVDVDHCLRGRTSRPWRHRYALAGNRADATRRSCCSTGNCFQHVRVAFSCKYAHKLDLTTTGSLSPF